MKHRRVLATIAAFVGLVAGGVAAVGPAHAAGGPGQDTQSLAPIGYRKIVHAINGKCADVSGMSTRAGALIHLWKCESSNDANQYWLPSDLGDGTFTLRNLNSGLCMNVQGQSTRPGTLIDQQSCDSRTGEKWHWRIGDTLGHRVLENSLPSPERFGLCLVISPYSAVNGARIVTAECATTDAQFWRFQPDD